MVHFLLNRWTKLLANFPLIVISGNGKNGVKVHVNYGASGHTGGRIFLILSFEAMLKIKNLRTGKTLLLSVFPGFIQRAVY